MTRIRCLLVLRRGDVAEDERRHAPLETALAALQLAALGAITHAGAPPGALAAAAATLEEAGCPSRRPSRWSGDSCGATPEARPRCG